MTESFSKEQMLATIRAGLAATRPWLEAEAAKAPHAPPPYVHPAAADLAAQFAAELGKLEGKSYLVADDEEALAVIAGIIAAADAVSAIAWDQELIGLPGLDTLLAARGVALLDARVTTAPEGRAARLQTLEPALVCISGVESAIAESATLLIRHVPGRPRLASLLAPVHIAVVRRAQLVRGLGAAIAQARARYGDELLSDSSNITLITGPSRTADIEMTLTLGIHGPREIHVVLIG